MSCHCIEWFTYNHLVSIVLFSARLLFASTQHKHSLLCWTQRVLLIQLNPNTRVYCGAVPERQLPHRFLLRVVSLQRQPICTCHLSYRHRRQCWCHRRHHSRLYCYGCHVCRDKKLIILNLKVVGTPRLAVDSLISLTLTCTSSQSCGPEGASGGFPTTCLLKEHLPLLPLIWTWHRKLMHKKIPIHLGTHIEQHDQRLHDWKLRNRSQWH